MRSWDRAVACKYFVYAPCIGEIVISRFIGVLPVRICVYVTKLTSDPVIKIHRDLELRASSGSKYNTRRTDFSVIMVQLTAT